MLLEGKNKEICDAACEATICSKNKEQSDSVFLKKFWKKYGGKIIEVGKKAGKLYLNSQVFFFFLNSIKFLLILKGNPII
jgi:hypothetical protein